MKYKIQAFYFFVSFAPMGVNIDQLKDTLDEPKVLTGGSFFESFAPMGENIDRLKE